MFARLISGLIFVLLALTVSANAQAPSDNSLTDQKPESHNREQGLSMLNHALVSSREFDPVDRASVQFIVSYTISQAEPNLAKESWDAAYDSLLQMKPEELQSLWELPGEIVSNTALVDPEKVEDQMPPEYLHSVAAAALVQHYARKDPEKAIELMDQIDQEPGLSDAANAILEKLDLQENRGLATTVYLKVLRHYQNSDPPLNTIGYPDDLAKLTLKYWQSLPAELVLSALDELAKEARQLDSTKGKIVVLTTPTTGAHAANIWQYRALQLIPVLRELDSARAEQWARQLGTTRATDIVTQDPFLTLKPSSEAGKTISSQNQTLRQNEYFLKIYERAQRDPDGALAGILALQDKMMRLYSLLNFSYNLRQFHPGPASTALSEFEKMISADERLAEAGNTRWAAGIAAELKHSEQAKRLLRLSMARITEKFKTDTQPDDPNLAATIFWPSVHEWRETLQVAYKVSPDYSLELLSEVPEGKVRSIEEALLASAFLNVEPWRSTSPMVDKKSMHKRTD